jgi:uncharacterized membrane protein
MLKQVIPPGRERLVNILFCSSMLCILMVAFRMIMSGSVTYMFLSWNLFLAWIPMMVSFRLNATAHKGASWLLFAVWLLFFPNCPYILTDLFHLETKPLIPLWFDLILILSFAWNGLMLGFVSLFEIHSFLDRNFTKAKSWLLVLCAIALGSFGIYLGRYKRWNSWDVLMDPIDLVSNIFTIIIHPFSHPRWLGVTILFTLFLSIAYFTLVSLMSSEQNNRRD